MTISWLSPLEPASRPRGALIGAVVAWLVLLLAVAAGPALATPQGVKVVAVHTVAAPQVSVIVTVPGSQPAPAGNPEQAAVSVDGTAVEATVTPVASPSLSVALVLNNTESAQQLRAAQTGATEFLLRLPVGGRTTVVASGAEPRVATPLTTELTEALSGVSALRPGSPGLASAAVVAAAEQLAAAPAGPRTLVLVSDGSPDGGPSVDEVTQALTRAQVVPTVISTDGGDFWSQVVERTGGTVRDVEPGAVVASFEDAATELANSYLVSFNAPGALPARAELTLQTAGGSATTGVTLPVAAVPAAASTSSTGGGLGAVWVAIAVVLLLSVAAVAFLCTRRQVATSAGSSSPAANERVAEMVPIADRLSSTDQSPPDQQQETESPVEARASWPAGIGSWIAAAREGNVKPLHDGLLTAAAHWPKNGATETDPAADLHGELDEVERDWRGRTSHDIAGRLAAVVNEADTFWRQRVLSPPEAGRSIRRLVRDAVGPPGSPRPPDEAIRGAVGLARALESYRAEHQPSAVQKKQQTELLRRITAWERPDTSATSGGNRKPHVDTYVILGDGVRNADELRRLVVDIDRVFQARCAQARNAGKDLLNVLAPLVVSNADSAATTEKTVLAGEGNATVDFPADVTRPAIVHIVGNESSNFFGVRTLGTDVALVNTASPYDGVRLLDWNGAASTGFEVQATGPWQIEILPPMSAVPFTSSHVGTGDSVLHFIGSGSVAEISGNGQSLYFGIRVGSIDGNAAEIVSTTDPCSESIPIDPDIEFFEIQAVGPWTIAIS